MHYGIQSYFTSFFILMIYKYTKNMESANKIEFPTVGLYISKIRSAPLANDQNIK